MGYGGYKYKLVFGSLDRIDVLCCLILWPLSFYFAKIPGCHVSVTYLVSVSVTYLVTYLGVRYRSLSLI